MKETENIPRRAKLEFNHPAELEIREALLAVEEMGADPKLTEAVNLLSHARDRVGDFIDGVDAQPDLQSDDIEAQVCCDIKIRQAQGIAIYGSTVATNPLSHREWLQHAYEEALDLAIYLKKILSDTP